MSQCFQVGDRILWNPSNGVAEIFARTADALVPMAGVPTGIGPMEADECQIDPDAFATFADALVRRYPASRHPILRSLVEGFTATALVLVHRAGGSVGALGDPPASDLCDVSAVPAGLAAPGDMARLQGLAEEHARTMPY